MDVNEFGISVFFVPWNIYRLFYGIRQKKKIYYTDTQGLYVSNMIYETKFVNRMREI